jgi:hypothetical protein
MPRASAGCGAATYAAPNAATVAKAIAVFFMLHFLHFKTRAGQRIVFSMVAAEPEGTARLRKFHVDEREMAAATPMNLHFVIPGRRQRVRAQRGPMATNPESITPAFVFSPNTRTQGVWIPGLRLRRIPE